MNCRSCAAPLTHTFVDLGLSPLANSFLKREQLGRMEPFYPLQALVCEKCCLVQLDEFESAQNIFSDYVYFSSYSASYLKHAHDYVEKIIPRLKLDSSKLVVEIASNDGYLLKNFLAHNIPILGVEPAANVAAVAIREGIRTVCEFFGEASAKGLRAQHGGADLIIANNVLAHVPHLNDFILGCKTLLSPTGVITFEFPHLLELIRNGQFDTIYHEHFCYFSLHSVSQALARHGLRVFDVEAVATHGESLRLYVTHATNAQCVPTAQLQRQRKLEDEAGLDTLSAYEGFAPRVNKIKRALLSFLIATRESGKSIAAYGAPAKGNTLFNFCGIRTDFIDFTVDRSPHKQKMFLPGTHIPVLPPEALHQRRPDFLLILPWNLQTEIVEQCSYIREWGGKFVVSHPELKVIP